MPEHDSKTKPSVSDSELEVLKTLWQESHLKVGEIRERLNRDGRTRAYNTVQTLLNRLEAKGFAGSEKVGRAFVFFPKVSQDQFLDHQLEDLADRICEGSQTPLMMALVKKPQFSRNEIQQFRQMLEHLEERYEDEDETAEPQP